MSIRIRSASDLGAAFLFTAVALLFLWQGRHLATGTASRMGPGFMPYILCGLLLAIALVLFVRAFVSGQHAPVTLHVPLRAVLFVPLSLVVFALLLRPAGLVAATVLSVLVGSISSTEARLGETVAVAAAMAALAVGLFVLALRLPMPIWPAW